MIKRNWTVFLTLTTTLCLIIIFGYVSADAGNPEVVPLTYEDDSVVYSKPHKLDRCERTSDLKKFAIANRILHIPYKDVVSGAYQDNGTITDFTAGHIKCINPEDPPIQAIKLIIRLPNFNINNVSQNIDNHHFYAARAIIKDKEIFKDNLHFFENEINDAITNYSILSEDFDTYKIYKKDQKQSYIVFNETIGDKVRPVFKCYPYGFRLGAFQTCKSLFLWREAYIVELYEISEPWVKTADLDVFLDAVDAHLKSAMK